MPTLRKFVRQGFLDQPLSEKIMIVVFYSGLLFVIGLFGTAAKVLH